MILIDDSRVVNKLEASLTDNARVIIYDHHMFIVQTTGLTFSSIRVINKLAHFVTTLVTIKNF